MRRLVLFAFEYLDPVRRRWIRARYRATIEDIAARHPAGHRLIGEPEVREVGDPAALTAGHIAVAPRRR